jgi:hypothetical protein
VEKDSREWRTAVGDVIPSKAPAEFVPHPQCQAEGAALQQYTWSLYTFLIVESNLGES